MDMKAKGKLFAVKSNDIKTETYYSWRVGTLVLCHTQHGGVIQIPSSSVDTHICQHATMSYLYDV